jgi:hypothetical protein
MPLIMYPFTGIAGNVAGTFAIPTVTPFFDRMDQIGSSRSMVVLAVIPRTTNPVIPFSSGGVLVAIVV